MTKQAVHLVTAAEYLGIDLSQYGQLVPVSAFTERGAPLWVDCFRCGQESTIFRASVDPDTGDVYCQYCADLVRKAQPRESRG